MPSAFQAGATLLLYGNDARYPTLAPAVLDRLAQDGVNSLAIVIPLYQSSRTANDIHINPIQTPSDEELASIVIDARDRGFSVLLRPVLDEGTLGPLPHWRGDIQPSSPTLWWVAYDSVFLHYATLAASLYVDSLGIGTELSSMESDASAWSALVAHVRTVYSGSLTYSSNWSSPLAPSFIASVVPALAFISVDAYYPLTNLASPTSDQLLAAWRSRVLPDLAQRTQAAHKPVVITELGIIPFDNVFNTPWAWQSSAAYDPLVQSRYYTSACQALKPQVSGLYWWQVGLVRPLAPQGGFDPLVLPTTESAIKNCYA